MMESNRYVYKATRWLLLCATVVVLFLAACGLRHYRHVAPKRHFIAPSHVGSGRTPAVAFAYYVEPYGESRGSVDFVVSDGRYTYTEGTTKGPPGFDNINKVILDKLDDQGNILWTRQFTATVDAEAGGLAVDSKHNVYVAGTAMGRLFSALEPSDVQKAFVAKLSPSGDNMWGFEFGTDLAVGDLAIDANARAVLVGTTRGSLFQKNPKRDVCGFIARISLDGRHVTGRQYDGLALGSLCIADGAIYASGGHQFPAKPVVAGRAAAVIRVSNDFRIIWSRSFGVMNGGGAGRVRDLGQNTLVVCGEVRRWDTIAGSYGLVAFMDHAGRPLRQHNWAVDSYCQGVSCVDGRTLVCGTIGPPDFDFIRGKNNSTVAVYASSGRLIRRLQFGGPTSEGLNCITICDGNCVVGGVKEMPDHSGNMGFIAAIPLTELLK